MCGLLIRKYQVRYGAVQPELHPPCLAVRPICHQQREQHHESPDYGEFQVFASIFRYDYSIPQ